MDYFEDKLKSRGLPLQFEGRMNKAPIGEQRQRQLDAQAGAEWDPNAADGLGGPSVVPFLKKLLNQCGMPVGDLPWLTHQLAAQIRTYGGVPCDPYFGMPYTFHSGGYNMPSINRKDNTKGHTRDNCEVIAARCNTAEHSAFPLGLAAGFEEALTEMRSQFDLSQAGALASAEAVRTAEARSNLR